MVNETSIEVSGKFHLRLAAMNGYMWNRWALTVISDINSVDVGEEISKLEKYSEKELKALYSELGLKQNQSLAVDVNLKGLNIRDIDFTHFLFPANADFSGAEFSGDVCFNRVRFCGQVDFSETKFRGEVDFSEAEFSGYVNFREAEFSGFNTYFNDAKFSGSGTHFHNTKFNSPNTHFLKTQFSCFAFFDNAKFSYLALFHNTTFEKSVSFISARFCKRAGFSDAKFSGEADFSNTKFCGQVSFNDAKFSDWVSFSDGKFRDLANFNKVEFIGSADFKEAKFHLNAIFNNIKFKDIPSFEKSHFNYPPVFHETEIKQGTSFHKVVWGFESGNPHEDKSAWKTLKQAMNKVHDHEQELLFFTFEMEAKIKLLKKDIEMFGIDNASIHTKIRSWQKKLHVKTHLVGLSLYRILSGFGTSIFRPFGFLCASYLFFTALYSLPGWGIPATTWSNGFQLSWGNMLPFASMTKAAFGTLGFDKENPIGLCLQIATAIQNFLSTGLIFLIGLATKHKLSIK
jgi:uncharacterized protein YjbI with pentapeptide repeats